MADTAHSSVANALALLGLRALVVPTAADGVFTAAARCGTPWPAIPTACAAVVASAGSTNAGLIDDLAGLAEVCAEHKSWLHVDGAYGLAALLAPAVRPSFAGIEAADSLIVDPHKWLFGPLDCCALLYRDPDAARAVHTQDAPYLDALHVDGAWNPADLAFHLTRQDPRAAGVVLARCARRGGLPPGGGGGAGPRPLDRRSRPFAGPTGRAGDGAHAVGRPVPAPRLDRGGLVPLVA